MPSLATRIRHSYANRGVDGSVDAALRYLISSARERRYDAASGVRTSGVDWRPAEELAHAATQYEASPPGRFCRILSALPLDPADATFVDLGCGKGRALVLALDHGFRRVVGVEFSAELAAVADENVRAYAARRSGVQRAEVVTGDAADYRFPPGPLVIYLYNPFHGPLVQRVMDNLAASLADDPRPVWVVYLNANYTSVVDATAGLARRPDVEVRAAARHPRGVRGYLRYERGDEFPLAIYATAPRPVP